MKKSRKVYVAEDQFSSEDDRYIAVTVAASEAEATEKLIAAGVIQQEDIDGGQVVVTTCSTQIV